MKHRDFIKGICLIVSLLCVSITSWAVAEKKPNILWIITEDMSPDIGCYGNRIVTTPNIDALATKGMKFTNAFATGPACSPSRTALATGVYQTTLGAHHMRYSPSLMPALPTPVKILPVLMRENGYYTGNVRGVGRLRSGTGKDDWQFKTEQKKWDTRSWNELTENQPFFGQIHLSESHRNFAKSKNQVTPDKVIVPPYYPDHSVSRTDFARYYEAINKADERIGDIIAQLENDSLTENTIVFFFGDHGRPMTRGKNWLYDSGTKVPLIIYIPKRLDEPYGYKAGGINSELVSLLDVTAETVLLGGGMIPAWMQGQSLLREDSEKKEYIYAALDRMGDVDSCSRSVRTHEFKYIHNIKTPGSINSSITAYRKATHPLHHLLNIMGDKGLLNPVQSQLLQPMAKEELYDLKNDPYEINNLIGDKEYATIHEELKTKLREWIKNSTDKGIEKESDAMVRHFREYGEKTMKTQKKSIDRLRLSVESHFKK